MWFWRSTMNSSEAFRKRAAEANGVATRGRTLLAHRIVGGGKILQTLRNVNASESGAVGRDLWRLPVPGGARTIPICLPRESIYTACTTGRTSRRIPVDAPESRDALNWRFQSSRMALPTWSCVRKFACSSPGRRRSQRRVLTDSRSIAAIAHAERAVEQLVFPDEVPWVSDVEELDTGVWATEEFLGVEENEVRGICNW